MNYNGTIKISYKKFDELCIKLAKQIQGNPQITKIYGVATGGFFVAARLSYLLNIPIVSHHNHGVNVLIVDLFGIQQLR